jgi:hypothetical protein
MAGLGAIKRLRSTGFIFRGSIPAGGADNIETALLLELPERAAADKFCADHPVGVGGLK